MEKIGIRLLTPTFKQMELQEKLNYCRVCHNRKLDMNTGIVCGLTNQKPQFEEKCPDIKVDEAEMNRLAKREQALQSAGSSGAMGLEQRGMQKGVAGGVIMIVIAIVWFVLGLAAGRIFFYPPILLIIGLVALIKGVKEGNISGEKYRN